MDTHKKRRIAVPGAFPVPMSRGESSQSSSGSNSNTPLTTVNELAQGLHSTCLTCPAVSLNNEDDDKDAVELSCPKRSAPKKGPRSVPPLSPAVANEFGVVVDVSDTSETLRAKGQGKGKGRADTTVLPSSPNARFVSPKAGVRSLATTHARRHIDLSSDSEDGLDGAAIATLKKEIAMLKKQLATRQSPSKSSSSSHSSSVDTELTKARRELAEQRTQVQKLEESNRKFRETVQTRLLCQICDELLHQPWALSPCGHVYCLACLQSWFKSSAEDNEEAEVIPRLLLKTCPYCRAKIRSRPVQIFVIKALVEAIHPGGPSRPEQDTSLADDPWKDIFSEESDADESDVDSEEAAEAHGGRHIHGDEECEGCGEVGSYDDEGYCRYCGAPGPEAQSDEGAETADDGPEDDEALSMASDGSFRNAVEWGTSLGAWSHRDDADSDEDQDDDDDAARPWILPRPAPACMDLDPEDNFHLTTTQLELCNRGVPFDMIQKYHVAYDEARGISAFAGRSLVCFGWNILDIEETDVDGTELMNKAVRDITARTEEWLVTSMGGGSWLARRLIRQGGPEDFEWDS